MTEAEYVAALDAKLNEEIAEYQESKSLEELADVLEVMMAIVKAKGCDWSEVTTLSQQKKTERGGFDGRIFLEKTICPDE